MTEIEIGEKYYIEVEVDSEHNKNAVLVVHPSHPANEYSCICVYKKHLISKEKLEDEAKRKEQE